ncbi:MAG: SMC-Scp complex subunit ScpB [Gammaproteobacteria bacterium]|nr:SMC-Scp complex subunit ScpB [Gammaproteobacteria bacterium]
MNERQTLRNIVEAILLAAEKPLDIDALRELFAEPERPTRKAVEQALQDVQEACEGRGFELCRVASGYRFQVRTEYAPWVGKLWEDKPQRYSRALLETLALIAYRQPITRGEIEDIRGVAVSTQIMKTLVEREWVRIVGHRDVPGRPAMYATTRQFLDYFNLTSLDQLPPLSEVRDLEEIGREVEARLQAAMLGQVEIVSEEAADDGMTIH